MGSGVELVMLNYENKKLDEPRLLMLVSDFFSSCVDQAQSQVEAQLVGRSLAIINGSVERLLECSSPVDSIEKFVLKCPMKVESFCCRWNIECISILGCLLASLLYIYYYY